MLYQVLQTSQKRDNYETITCDNNQSFCSVKALRTIVSSNGGAVLWNSPPLDVRQATSLTYFRRLLTNSGQAFLKKTGLIFFVVTYKLYYEHSISIFIVSSDKLYLHFSYKINQILRARLLVENTWGHCAGKAIKKGNNFCFYLKLVLQNRRNKPLGMLGEHSKDSSCVLPTS